MYTAFFADKNITDKKNPNVKVMTLSFYENRVFLYMETSVPDLSPEDAVEGSFLPLPDGTHWQRMADVFHYSYPQSEAHWKRTEPIRALDVRINFLKPDMVGSYVFYHHQFQEECPGGNGGDKYGIIFLLGNMIVMHLEPPYRKDETPGVGKLHTNNTPHDTWQSLMNSHFVGWDDSDEYWKNIECRVLCDNE